MPRGFRLYPLVFAAVPILHLQANNANITTLTDLVVVTAVAVAAFAAVQVLALLALRPAGLARLAPLLTLVASVWFFGFRPMAERLAGSGLPAATVVLAVAGLLASVAVLLGGIRRPEWLDPAGRFLLLTGLLLAGFNAADIARDRMRAAELVRESRFLRQVGRAVPGPDAAPRPARDIYVIIVDQYGGSDVLRERYGIDNRPFEDSLRALGFHLPAVVRSNYAQTMLSIPSLLNAAHLAPLEHEMRGHTDPSVVNALVARSRVADFLTRRGYRYVFFPSKWWHATRSSPQAQVVPQVWGGFDPLRDLSRTELRRVVLGSSLLPGRLVNRITLPWDADHQRRTIRGMAEARRYGRPVYVVAHLISPHPPYSADADCRPRPRPSGYRATLECLNRQLLELVTDLVRSSEVAPIILIQGDHGTRSLRFEKWPSPDRVPADATRERHSTFGAYYLPDGGAAAFGDTVTVVNVLGNVLRHYFGARLPREPDEMYLSLPRNPFDFHRVGADWRAREEALAAQR